MNENRSLHICIFANELSIHTRRWVLGLRGMGHRVDLVTLKKDPQSDIGGIHLGASSKLAYLSKVGWLRRLVRELGPDIFHAHHASSYGFLASFIRHPRKILSVWGNDIVDFPNRGPIHRKIIKRSLTSPIQITATSEFLKRSSLDFGWRLPPISVIPFGIDLEIFRRSERKARSEVKIGIAKALAPKYGIDILIRAFAKVIEKGVDAKLLIAGKGPSEAVYKKLAVGLSLQNKIEFLGFLTQEKVAQFMREIDIFAMPSLSEEGFGVAALEAAATGLPVVASKVGGVPEVVVDGRTGILVERGNINGLAAALTKLAHEPELRLRYGLGGRRLVENNYTWQRSLKQMNDLYIRLMA
jgi:glycosyltransferase involved in cell wall biosynthesis